MRHSKAYIQTHDLDWFGRINNQLLIHVATNGSPLPERVNDIERLHENHISVMQMPEVCRAEDLLINERAIVRLFENQRRLLREYREVDISGNDYSLFFMTYLRSFIPIAMRGIITFDCTLVGEEDKAEYHVVCRPRNLNKLAHEFPEGIESFEIENIDLYYFPQKFNN